VNNLIQQLIVKIDDVLSRQINTLLHHRQFQQLEACWRGLNLLVSKASCQNIIIKILTVSYQELSRDLLNAIEFDQSHLFQKIYANEFDHPGGQPFGLLIGDYYFNGLSQDLETLSIMSKIAAAAFAPFISAVHQHFFGLDHFNELKVNLSLTSLFQQKIYNKWQSLRKDEDARFLGLTLPKILLRKPYNHTLRINHRFFSEIIEQPDDYLWGNAAYAYAIVIIQAFSLNGWFTDIRGINPITLSGGVINLPREYFTTDPCFSNPKLVTEMAITDQQERQLNELGFLALKDHPHEQLSIFYSSQSLQVSAKYSNISATTNAKISTMLHYILCASRFAHYKIGSFTNADDCESYLQSWLLNYCTANPENSAEISVRYPLNEACVHIHEQAGFPGKYSCTIHLKPHYQLDDIQSQFHLVTDVIL